MVQVRLKLLFPKDFAADLPLKQAQFEAQSQILTAAKVFSEKGYHAAGIADEGKAAGVEAAIRADGKLSTSQKSALITVYRSMVGDS